MDDALLVGALEGLGYLLRDDDCLVERQRPALQSLAEVLAFHQLQHQEQLSARLLEAMDRRDVRVVERREQLRLAAEAGQPLGILRHLGGQHLEGHLAPELRVRGAVDLAHTAGPEGRVTR